MTLPQFAREDSDTFEAFEVTVAQSDFNADKVNELIVWESSWAGTGGGGLWILSKTKKGYKKLFEADSAWTPITVLPAKKNGWSSFSYFVIGGGVDPVFVTVEYDGTRYVDKVEVSKGQPEGAIVIEKKWSQTTFGPMPDN